MKRLRVAILALTACTPTFRVPSPPTLPMDLPRAPAAPQPAEVPVPPPGVRADATSAHAPADLRAQTLAVVLVGPAEVVAATQRRLPLMLVARRFTRVLYPSLQSVETTLERGEASERVTFRGSLPQLALLQARTPAGHLLQLEVRGDDGPEVLRSTYAISPAELAAYRDGLEAYRVATERWRARLQQVVAPYRETVTRTRQAYEQDGGRYRDPGEQELLSQVSSWDSEANTLLASSEAALRGAPTPEQLVERASRTQGEALSRRRVSVRATLTDLTAGETYWIDEVEAVSPTLDEALSAALARALDDLSPAPTP